ncbi:MAG: hypothetical protein ACXVH2_10885, partial [Methanobacterium sp.]
ICKNFLLKNHASRNNIFHLHNKVFEKFILEKMEENSVSLINWVIIMEFEKLKLNKVHINDEVKVKNF